MFAVRLVLLPSLLLVLAIAPPARAHETHAFAPIDAALASGELSAEQALLYKLQHVFEPEAVPEHLRGAGLVRCATPLVVEAEAQRASLSPRVRDAMARYFAPESASKVAYASPGGHFELSYTTSGTDAVPAADLNPINGVPDFVERVAQYFDESWNKEIVELGFTAPSLGGGRYQISFENMGSYGYTALDGGAPGGTVIVMHNNFNSFPPNSDPDGNALGAAKVTAAHEFKHAVQYATSQWSEGDWVELDATWMEDIVYDDTNDYYNYLPSQSPISSPTTSLDSGGGGSYEDCVWQHYLSETYGDQLIVDFASWRSTHQGQSVLASYDAVLQTYGGSLRDDWPVFTAWNYATGLRAAPGFGYGEAGSYPTSPVATFLTTYPAQQNGSLGTLAATFVSCASIPDENGHLRVSFARAAGSMLELTAIVTRNDGTTVLERVPLIGDVTGDVALATPLAQIDTAGFSISNGATTGGAATWSLEVQIEIDLPDPAPAVSATLLETSLDSGTSGQTTFEVSNVGAQGSTLNYEVLVMQSWPTSSRKSVEGSTVAISSPTYAAGTTTDFVLTVTNASPDEEWLTDVTVTFPAGVTVNSSTDMVGGTDGPLTTDGSTGESVTVSWNDLAGGYGNIYGNGQQASATVNLTFGASLTGDLTVGYSIQGDIWGGQPHFVTSSFTMSPPPVGLDLTSPNGAEVVATGEVLDIVWDSTGELFDVRIELSRDGSASWEVLEASTPNDGRFEWTVSGPSTSEARVRVGSIDGTVADKSEGSFLVYDPVTWASATPGTGSLDEGDQDLITVDLDASLAEGVYTAQVVVLHDGLGDPKVIPLTLTVTPAPTASPQSAPNAFRLVGNFPNPFNPATQIRFQLATAEDVSVRVYGPNGRLVRTLVDRRLAAGEHAAVWNGRDASGRDVASGVYWYRLETPSFSDTKSMVLVR